jgi:hypothetical protein
MSRLRIVAPIAAAIVLALAPAALLAQERGVEERSTRVSFPATLTAGGHRLAVSGAGVRKRFLFKVYAGAFYLDPIAAHAALARYRGVKAKDLVEDERFARDLVNADFAKAVALRLVRDVSAADMRKALLDGISKTAPPDAAARDFVSKVSSDLKAGDSLVFTWLPGGRCLLAHNGERTADVQNAPLAAALQRIWLGPEPISIELKEHMLERIPAMLR